MDAAMSMLLLLGFFKYLSLYHRLRARQFNSNGHSYDENEEGLRRTERRAMVIMVGSTYDSPNYYSYGVSIQTREALGIAVFQVVRVVLLLIPVCTSDFTVHYRFVNGHSQSALDGYFILSCLSGKVRLFIHVRTIHETHI